MVIIWSCHMILLLFFALNYLERKLEIKLINFQTVLWKSLKQHSQVAVTAWRTALEKGEIAHFGNLHVLNHNRNRNPISTKMQCTCIFSHFSLLHFAQPVDAITSQSRLLFTSIHDAFFSLFVITFLSNFLSNYFVITFLSLLSKTLDLGRINFHDGGCRETVSTILNDRRYIGETG